MSKLYNTQETVKIVIPYAPRRCQRDIEKRLKLFRFLVAVCHRRFGKTVNGVIWLIQEALSGIPDFRGYYIAPNQKQAKRLVWSYFKKYLHNFGDLVTFNETELRIDFNIGPNKPCIYLAGSENIESLRGVYIDRAVLDEMASWDKAEYAFYEVIYPAMSDRQGRGFIIGTVKGLDLFYDLHCMGNDKKMYPDWDTVIFDVTQTGVFTDEQIDELRRMMRPDAFAREYMCDFFAEAPDRLISPQVVEDAVGREVPDHVVRSSAEIWGFDVGYTGDPSKLVKRKGPLMRQIITLDNKDSVYQATYLKGQIDRFHPKALYIDAGYGEGVIAQLNNLGYEHLVIPVFFGQASPSPGCFNMRAYMYLMFFKWLKSGCIPRNDNLIKQLSNVLLDESDTHRRVKLKPKKEIKAVIRMSPDEADAGALTFAGGDMDMLDIDDVLKDGLDTIPDSSLREILKAYSQPNYNPDEYMDQMSGGDILSKLDNEFN
jgi:hypothetical protein